MVHISRYGYPSFFLRMFVLAVTSSDGYQVPPVSFDKPDDLTDLQRPVTTPSCYFITSSGWLMRPVMALAMATAGLAR